MSIADIRALTVFRAIVEHGGFAGAQLALSMSQSNVSFYLNSLEARLGFSLCRRGRRGFELTPRGAAVYEQSHALNTALSRFEGQLGELRNKVSGTLRVGIVDTTVTDATLGIDEVVRQVAEKAPEVDLRLTIAEPEHLVGELAKGTLDLAVMPKLVSLQGYTQQEFHVETHSLFCGNRHPLFDQAQVSNIDVTAADFVVRPYANRSELQHFPDAHVRAYASNVEAQAIYILSGRFVGYLPDHAAHAWGAGNRLRRLLAPQTQITSRFAIFSRSEAQVSLAHRLFVSALVRRAGNPASSVAPAGLASATIRGSRPVASPTRTRRGGG